MALSKNHKENYRRWSLMRMYGLTLDQYDQLRAEQKECCGVCGLPESTFGKKLAVDHSHVSGMVRGLLCNACNHAIGLFKDRPEFARAAADYLAKPGLRPKYSPTSKMVKVRLSNGSWTSKRVSRHAHDGRTQKSKIPLK